MPTSTKQQAPTPVRLPPELKQWIRRQAESNLRSVNAEIVAVLMAEQRRREKRAVKTN